MTQLTIYYARERHSVRNLADASAEFRAWIDRNGFGGSDLKRKDGEVRRDGKLVARISYNGRAWPPVEWTPGQADLPLNSEV